MRSGTVNLDKLLEYVKYIDPSGESLDGDSPSGIEYGKLAKNATATIADEQGFYLWGKYEKKGLWINIYLGKAGYSEKAHLRARILEELKDERAFLWYSKLGEKKLLAKGQRYYQNMWVKKYKEEWIRAMRKDGTSHIIWVAASELDGSIVTDIENDLIETLNPTANQKRVKPPSEPQRDTVEVIGYFRREIHNNRPSK